MLCLLETPEDLALIAVQPEPLKHIGFTDVVLGPGIATGEEIPAMSELTKQGLTVHKSLNIESAVDLSISSGDFSASAFWRDLEAEPRFSLSGQMEAATGQGRSRTEAAILLQMTSRPVPIVHISRRLVYSSELREQRELLRSLVFWRKRFDIAQHSFNLVHAGDDGLLIFTVDSWLVTLNQNPEESSIDLGNHGSMWLMLGTQRDVHLHGSMLILPAWSGAIVANELAR